MKYRPQSISVRQAAFPYLCPLAHFRCAGTIGHVAHGKSTVVKAISGVMTVRFKNELVRNITIKLGYANAKVRAEHLLQKLISILNRRTRSTNAKMKPVHVQGAIALIVLIKKITLLVNAQDVAIV